MRDVLTYSYWLILALVSLYLIFRFRKMDKAARIICLLIWLGAMTEGIGYLAAIVFHNNYPVYNVSVYIEFVLISLYFNYSIPILRRKKTGIYIAIAGFLSGGMNTVFLQPINSLNSNFLFLECLCVLCFSLFAIYRMLISDKAMDIHRNLYFWFTIVLLFNQCTTLSAWGLYESYSKSHPSSATILDYSILFINSITYVSHFLIFYYNSKLKLSNVQYR